MKPLNWPTKALLVALLMLLGTLQIILIPIPSTAVVHMKIGWNFQIDNSTVGCELVEFNLSGVERLTLALPFAVSVWGVDVSVLHSNDTALAQATYQWEGFNSSRMSESMYLGAGIWTLCYFAAPFDSTLGNSTLVYPAVGTFSLSYITDLAGAFTYVPN